MKKIGIIGGIGPASTIEYYKKIVEGFRKHINSDEYPDLVIHSINMTEMLSYVSSNNLDGLVKFFEHKIRSIEKIGVDSVAIASNTPHWAIETLKKKVSIELVDIVEETCKQVKQKEIRKVGLIGTNFTMTKGFYQRSASKYDIEIVIPDQSDRNYIHTKYFSELVFNQALPETKREFLRIIEKLHTLHKIGGLILGGTEIPLLIQQTDCKNLHLFDTTEIHVEAILDRMKS